MAFITGPIERSTSGTALSGAAASNPDLPNGPLPPPGYTPPATQPKVDYSKTVGTGVKNPASSTDPLRQTPKNAPPAYQGPSPAPVLDWVTKGNEALKDWENLWPMIEARQGTANAANTRQAEGRMAAMGRGFGGGYQGVLAQSALTGQDKMRQQLIDWTKGGVDLKNAFSDNLRSSEESALDREARQKELELQFGTGDAGGVEGGVEQPGVVEHSPGADVALDVNAPDERTQPITQLTGGTSYSDAGKDGVITDSNGRIIKSMPKKTIELGVAQILEVTPGLEQFANQPMYWSLIRNYVTRFYGTTTDLEQLGQTILAAVQKLNG